MSASTDILGTLGVRFAAIGADEMKSQIAGVTDTVTRAKGGMKELGQETEKASVNMKKLSFAVFGASLSVTSIIQQNNRFQRQLTEIEAKQVQMARTEASIATQRLRLAKIVEKYGRDSEQASIAVDRLRASEQSLAVKTKELANAQEDLNTMWITFAVNLSSSVLFSYIGLREALRGVSAATIRATFDTRVFNTAQAASAGFMIKSAFAAGGLRAGLLGVSAGIKTVLASIPVLGWALLAVGTAIEIFAFDAFGLRTELEKLLGIHKDMTKAATEAGDEFDNLNSIMDDSNQGYLIASERIQKIKDELNGVSRAARSAGGSIGALNDELGSGGLSGGGGGVGGTLTGGEKGLFDKFTQSGFTDTSHLEIFINQQGQRMRGIRNELKSAIKSEMEQELQSAINRTERLKIIAGWQEEINLIKKSGLEYDKEEIAMKEHIINALRRMNEHQVVFNKEKKKSVDLDKEAVKQAEELKKKLSSVFGFLRAGANRHAFLAGETNFFTGEEGIPFSGVLGRRNHVFNTSALTAFLGIQAMSEVASQNIESFQKGEISAAVFMQNVRLIEASIKSQLSGPGFRSGTQSLVDFVNKQGLAGGFGQATIQFDLSRLSTPSATNKQGFTGPGFTAARGSGGAGRSVARGGSQSKGRSSKHGGQKGAPPETQFWSVFGFQSVARNTDYYLNLAQRNYNEAVSLIMRAGLPLPGGRMTPDVARSILAQAEVARRVIRERERKAVLEGLNIRLGREDRFKAHVAEFGLKSVMAGGGTAVDFDVLIPLIRAAIQDSQDASNYDKYWQLSGALKPV